MMSADWLSVLPPIVAIAVVLWRREVILALFLAVFTAEFLQQTALLSGIPLAGMSTLERIVGVFDDKDNARILIFSLMIGALLAFIRQSGGVTAMVSSIINRGIARNGRQAALPLFVMVAAMVGFMFWTGDGVLANGSGSRSVLYSVSLACLVGYLMMLKSGSFTHIKLVRIGFEGMGELLPLVTIVLFSLALGASLKDLGTGIFIAGLVGEYLPVFLVVPMLFLAGALISFSTGTSWGTFAILIPIGVPLIQAFGLPPSLVLAAILGGGVFGDHCSPISDTTAVSAIASGCDLLEHVRTQLPYALVAGGITLFMYTVAGVVFV